MGKMSGTYPVYAEVRIRKVRSAKRRKVFRVSDFMGTQEQAERMAQRIARGLVEMGEGAINGPSLVE
jgi:hypothetical protein